MYMYQVITCCSWNIGTTGPGVRDGVSHHVDAGSWELNRVLYKCTRCF